MKVCVFGSGYVGLVAGACFAESGNDVICVDVDANKIKKLEDGIIPIYEPGLSEMVKRNIQEKRLSFTTDAKKAVQASTINFIAVGTPPGEDGSADLQYVLKVAETIATHMEQFTVIVDKSTVPIGTAAKVRKAVTNILQQRNVEIPFDIVSNPEFLREGDALNDFMKPDRVVIGATNPDAAKIMKDLYLPFTASEEQILIMNVESAEMTKYAANSFLATKISFMNEIANLCEKVTANIDEVRKGIGMDVRIGQHFLASGVGYGGSCFPKDVKALIRIGYENQKTMELLEAVENINKQQKEKLIEMVVKKFGNDLTGKLFGIWGLAFKPETDDMREAPSRVIINGLLEKGAKIIANDPAAIEESQKIWPNQITYREEPYEVLENIDALLIITEWNHYQNPDFDRIKKSMKTPLIFDGRNIYNPKQMIEQGFEYYSIGRP